MKLIYGLGNPGREYAYTRHNIGYMVVESLSRLWNIRLDQLAPGIEYGRGKILGEEVMLARPRTFMNLSGGPLKEIGADPGELVVIYDDMDIPAGGIRVRGRGSSGGHRGLQSVMDSIDSGDFVRVRCGIGRPVSGCEPREYVLENFKPEEKTILSKQIQAATEAVCIYLQYGVERAMNVCNRRDVDNPST